MLALVETATAVKSTIECAIMLAAPKVAQRQHPMPTRVELLAVLDEYLRVLREPGDLIDDTDGPVAKKMEPYARRLRDLVETWTPTPEVPIDIRLAARTMIDGMGMPCPPRGWDEFEGFNPDDE